MAALQPMPTSAWSAPGTRSGGDGYYLTIGTVGGLAVLKLEGDRASTLRESPAAPAFGGTGSLRLTCETAHNGAAHVTASVNGHRLATVGDPDGFDSFTGVALLVTASEAGTTVRFDNVLARISEGPNDR